jgi:hypothetical protein
MNAIQIRGAHGAARVKSDDSGIAPQGPVLRHVVALAADPPAPHAVYAIDAIK